MSLKSRIAAGQWIRITLFYVAVLIATYFARLAPNVLTLLLGDLFGFVSSFNYNHGIAALIVTALFYRFSGVRQTVTLLGTNRLRSLLFPLVPLIGYGISGLHNGHGLNPHLWALTVCCFALVYNIMEEYAWRAFVPDCLNGLSLLLKGLLSGILWACWHLLFFSSFSQYGGFGVFLIFCIVFALILTFTAARTRSVLVAASVHAFMIQVNVVALIILVVFAVLLLTWNRSFGRRRERSGWPEV